MARRSIRAWVLAHPKLVVALAAFVLAMILGVTLTLTRGPEADLAVETTTTTSVIPDTTVEPSDTTISVPDTTTSATSTSTPDTTIPTGQPTDDDVKACQKRVSAENVKATFGDQLAMTVGKSSPVVVILTLGNVPLPAGDTIPSAPVTTTVTFKQFTCEVAAQLHGLNFEIDNPDKVPQSFVYTDELTWEWHVTPTSTSADEVNVDFYPAIRTSSGALIPGQIRTATLKISVKAAPGPSVWHQIRKWVFGVGLIALSAILVAWAVATFGPGKNERKGPPPIFQRLSDFLHRRPSAPHVRKDTSNDS